jgi:hypothetical protein
MIAYAVDGVLLLYFSRWLDVHAYALCMMWQGYAARALAARAPVERAAMATKIRGIEGMKNGELDFEIQRGGKFVLFQYCISIIVLTFRRPSDIYFLRQGESAVTKGLPFTLLSLVAGWWGIPWGPIYTIQSAYNNSCGGKDVTQAVLNSLRAQAAAPVPASPIPAKN